MHAYSVTACELGGPCNSLRRACGVHRRAISLVHRHRKLRPQQRVGLRKPRTQAVSNGHELDPVTVRM